MKSKWHESMKNSVQKHIYNKDRHNGILTKGQSLEDEEAKFMQVKKSMILSAPIVKEIYDDLESFTDSSVHSNDEQP